MGKPVPMYVMRILRDDGTECDTGETGEICISIDPHPAGIMMEYYRNPEKTAEAMHDGWYHTGDTAWRDEEGNYWYVGRNDDVIKSSGYRIGPFEIESVMLEHDAVREVARSPACPTGARLRREGDGGACRRLAGEATSSPPSCRSG